MLKEREKERKKKEEREGREGKREWKVRNYLELILFSFEGKSYLNLVKVIS